MTSRTDIERDVSEEEISLLEAMAGDAATDDWTRKRAVAVLTFLRTGDLQACIEASGMSRQTVRKSIARFNESGWQGLLKIPAPRGGDFLARYDQGYWAERLARVYLDNSATHRAIPYGTSRSEPFSDLQTFRDFAVSEFLLQAWSAGLRWKRPDILMIPRAYLRELRGNDAWTPDLKHWDNRECQPFVERASAAVEVETSLWQVKKATVDLSFTVKEEDLDSLRNWVHSNEVALYVLQVFYDQAYVLPFSTLEARIDPDAPDDFRVVPEVDRTTRKSTYRIPLSAGHLLGDIPEPDVEGRVYKAPNGRVTVYGRLTGSRIEIHSGSLLEDLGAGQL